MQVFFSKQLVNDDEIQMRSLKVSILESLMPWALVKNISPWVFDILLRLTH